MNYQKIIEETKPGEKGRQAEHRSYLYSAIYKDISAILKILLPTDTAMVVGQHIKSAMYSLIELKTGQRPRKF